MSVSITVLVIRTSISESVYHGIRSLVSFTLNLFISKMKWLILVGAKGRRIDPWSQSEIGYTDVPPYVSYKLTHQTRHLQWCSRNTADFDLRALWALGHG